MPRLRSILLALSALVASAGAAAAQESVDVSFTIRAEDGGAAIAGAQVEVMGTRRIATANGEGVARMRVPTGPALFEIRKLGYGTERFSLNLPATDTLGIDVVLAVAPVRLRGLEATATATQRALRDNGFYDRQQMGVGVFLTERDIARHAAARLIDAFRRVPGIRVVRYLPPMGQSGDSRSAMDIDEQYQIATTRGGTSITGSPRCWLEVYVDDLPVGSEALTSIPVSEVTAVEVYRGAAETPARYRKTANSCGALVMWTKRGRAS